MPFALLLLQTTKTILIGEFFFFEKLIRDFKLVPLPEIKQKQLTFFYHLTFPFR